MVLKQWRVPSTFRFGCLTTKFLTCSGESAENNASVLYWTLPAQFISLSPNAQESKVESTGVSVNNEHSLRNIRLFTEVSFGLENKRLEMTYWCHRLDKHAAIADAHAGG